MIKNKIIKIVCICIVIISLLVCFLPWRNEINTKLQGVQCRIGDKNYSENISVTIKGDYYDYLFKKDTFKGVILIDKYGSKLNGSKVSLKFKDNIASLEYQVTNNGLPKSFGVITCSKDFKQVLICLSEPIDGSSKSWSGENGLFISAPSENRSQALDIAKSLSMKNKWLSSSNWD